MDSVEYAVDRATTRPTSEPVVSVHGLVKRFGRHEAVAGIDLEVRRGEIFAFLGPNGAGKTTTIEILEGFQPRTRGHVRVLGHDPATAGRAWRDQLGVVLQASEPEPHYPLHGRGGTPWPTGGGLPLPYRGREYLAPDYRDRE